MRNKKDEFSNFYSIIKQKKSFIVIGHIHPEGDCIGSTLATALYLKSLGKEVTAYNENDVPDNLKFLPGSETMINTVKGINQDVCIFVDCADKKRSGKIIDEVEKSSALRVNIDHHYTNDSYGDINIIDDSASATGEIIYDFLRFVKHPIDLSIGQNIYTAILTDTGSFRYSNSTVKAFTTASSLVDLGVKPWDVAMNLYENQSVGRVKLLSIILSTLDIRDGFASIVILKEMLEKTSTNSGDIDGFINYPRSIKSVSVAIQFRELEDKTFKISFRSKGNVDVSGIAMAFNGGGHKNAAACLIKDDLSNVKETIYKHVEREIKNA